MGTTSVIWNKNSIDPLLDTIPGYWMAPAGVNSIQVECWGTGAMGRSGGNRNYGIGGGGGGAYAKTNSVQVTPGKTYQCKYIPPIGGTDYGIAGGWPEITFFNGNDASCVATSGRLTNDNTGGFGGKLIDPDSEWGGCVGDVKFAGGNGGNGFNGTPGCGGGGGGCGGTDGSNATQTVPGIGGIGSNGGGNGGQGGLYQKDGTHGITLIPGAGSGGPGSKAGPAGGPGEYGQIKLTWTIPENIVIGCTVS
jgi:hypothetical protein